eukprot:scaffold124137_cov33-Tisochrysis_lutea.AAC.2
MTDDSLAACSAKVGSSGCTIRVKWPQVNTGPAPTLFAAAGAAPGLGAQSVEPSSWTVTYKVTLKAIGT